MCRFIIPFQAVPTGMILMKHQQILKHLALPIFMGTPPNWPQPVQPSLWYNQPEKGEEMSPTGSDPLDLSVSAGKDQLSSLHTSLTVFL